MKMSVVLAEQCNSLSHFVNIVYSYFRIMYCIVSYCILCMYFNLLSVYHCVNEGYQK